MRKLITLLSLVLILILGTATVAGAFEVRRGDSFVTLGRNETINDDMMIAGNNVVIDGTVNGDVLALAQAVTVSGTINGNLIAFGARVEVNGAVNGAVIGAGETLTVEGTVQRSVIGAGSRVLIGESAQIGGSLIAAGDQLEHRGTIARGAALAGSSMILAGKVGREIKAAGEHLAFTGSANVSGPVEFYSRRQAVVAPGAKTGTISHFTPRTTDWQQFSAPWFLRPGWAVLKFGGFMAVGLVLLSLFPALRRRTPEVVATKLWQAPLAGFLVLIATPVAAIIMMITVIGVPLGLITLIAYPVLIYTSQVLIAWGAGSLLAERVPALQNQSWPVLLLIGALLTTILMEVPFFGGIVAAASLCYGLGTIWLMITERSPVV